MGESNRIAGIGEMVISSNPNDKLIAPNLGSCLGIAVWEPKAKVGGLIHCMLPLSKSNPEKAKQNPGVYVDTGFPLMLRKVLAKGGNKKNLLIAVAGGSNINDANNYFEVGKRNFTVLRKLLWQNQLMLKAEDVGDSIPRTISLDIGTGEIWLKARGRMTRLL